jgi:glycosyltransferase involved in cell wall biosynthesis
MRPVPAGGNNVVTGAVLYDQSNVAYRMGTGVATYARNLATAARYAGFNVEALVSTDVKVDLANPLLAEVQLFDVQREPLLPWLEPVTNAIRGVVRAPFGYRPRLLPRVGAVLQASGGAPAFDRTYVGARLFNVASAHFYVHGRFTNVTLPTAPTLFHATFPLPIRVAGCANIVTIHDLVPLRLPSMTLDNKRYFFRLIQRHLAEADHIVTVSEFSRQDIIALFGVQEARITNTYQAVTLPPGVVARSDDAIADQITNLFDLDPGNYYLFLGALEPKKNVGRLIDAYAASGSRRPLVIAGGQGWQNKADIERIEDTRFSNYQVTENTISKVKRVRRIPYLPLDQLVVLMRGARALLFPSLYEGFGLPVLEAMSLGTPVMTSNVTSLPEIAGDAALLVDPRDINAMAAAIRNLDNDTDLLSELSDRGRVRAQAFSMANYQVRLQNLYSMVLGTDPTRQRHSVPAEMQNPTHS